MPVNIADRHPKIIANTRVDHEHVVYGILSEFRNTIFGGSVEHRDFILKIEGTQNLHQKYAIF
jgi:hypothetical protein